MANLPTETEAQRVQTFALAYLETWDATKSYKKIFPDAKNCRGEASKFLAREDVKQEMARIFALKTAEANVGIERVLKELEAMAFVKLDDYAEFIETANGRTIPVLDAEKIKDNPMLMSVLTGKFKRIIDKDGGTHDVYELDTHNKQAALFKLMDYHLTMAGKLAPAANRPVMNFHVNFPIPGSGWRNKSQSPDPIDLEPIDQ